MLNADINLKSCPFCGGEMEPLVMCFEKAYEEDYQKWLKENKRLPNISTGFSSGWVVHCYHCGAKSRNELTKELAAKAWNKRSLEVMSK